MCEEMHESTISKFLRETPELADHCGVIPLPNGQLLYIQHLHSLLPIEKEKNKYHFKVLTTLKTYKFCFKSPDDALYLWTVFAEAFS